MIEWTKVLENNISLGVQTQVAPTKGNLVYEYNPFRNYRLTRSMYEYKDNIYSLDELERLFGIYMSSDEKSWYKRVVSDDGNSYKLYKNRIYSSEQALIDRLKKDTGKDNVSVEVSRTPVLQVVSLSENTPTLREKGELVDFITDELSFDLSHPVNITPLYSYDGSVNLILNDGINTPKLINSRFSATGRNTYEVIDRKGNNDTNIYDLGEAFEIDTSLYKSVTKIPKISFEGCFAGGNMKIGNYHFYFKLADSDGNETDFVGESGLVSVFIGFDDPHSITSGLKNENSFKSVKFLIDNIDISYDYVYVYYSRYTAERGENSVTEYIKIDKKFTVNNAGICNILINGYEETQAVSSADINLHYNIVDSAKAQTTCLNMLFLGNVHKPNIPYEELLDLSLRFLPYLKQENYQLDMDLNYNIVSTELGYYDSKFIYEKTGYWAGELYRLGIVYIMPNGELTPVFNIRGGTNITEFAGGANDVNVGLFMDYPLYDEEGNRQHIIYNEETNYLIAPENNQINENVLRVSNENNKGVVKFAASKDTNIIYSLDIRVSQDVVLELSKYVKGYFFVRQSRIPTILAQGITIGIDQESHTPVVATAHGVLDQLANSLDYTHVETRDINDVNYISEGFLSRYKFKFKAKSSSVWSKIGKAVAITVAVVAVAVAAVYTGGAALALASGAATTLGAAATAGTAAVVGTVGSIAGAVGASTVGVVALGTTAATVGTATALAIGTGVAVAGIAAGMAVVGGILEARYGLSRLNHRTIPLKGRETKCPSGYKIVEVDESRKLGQDFNERLIIKDSSKVKVLGILCPDYEVDQPYYNQIFTGNKHKIQLTSSQCINGLAGEISNYFTNEGRHFYVPQYYDMNIFNSYDFKIIGVPDDVAVVGIEDLKFRSRAGNAEEPWRYECVGDDYKSEYSKENADEDEETISNKKINGDIIRGSFGPYLAFNDENNKFSPAETVNIYIPEYSQSKLLDYIQIRMLDDSPYHSISDRISVSDLDEYRLVPKSQIMQIDDDNAGYKYNLYRGDCYICQFTHRLNRNFNAPSAPYNHEIVDPDSWKDNYDPDKPEKYADINLGDVDAVELGMWVTFRVRSSKNLNIRTLDGSYVDESVMTGHPRGYYPYLPMSTEGTYKKPESSILNKGFCKNLNERVNFNLPDVPYIKNWFGTRIMYSNIHINDAYQNGFRVFKGTNYRDYTREYGEIVKLLTLDSDIICIFEHGVARIPVNERTVAGQGSGGNVYINTSNVLPENPRVISDMYGSQWADSILKVPGKTGSSKQYIYGVDTVAKKIWRTDGLSLECISDLRVQEFLNNNITLGERELTPILGVRNVKTCYNAYKQDVLFTFYDNTYGFEEKVWNLCWNERLLKFITFYSWVPSMMENINNIPFSFDRNVSKWIAKLGTSHSENSFADGITLSNVVINNYFKSDSSPEIVDNFEYSLTYLTKDGQVKETTKSVLDLEGFDSTNYIGVLNLSNRSLPDLNLFYEVSYSLERDPWNNYLLFEIKKIGETTLPEDAKFANSMTHDGNNRTKVPVYALYLKRDMSEDNGFEPVVDINAASIYDESGGEILCKKVAITPEVLMSELYYRNKAKHAYSDYDVNKTKYLVTDEPPVVADELTDANCKMVGDIKVWSIDLVETQIAKRYYHLSEQEVSEIRSWINSLNRTDNYQEFTVLSTGLRWSHDMMLKSKGGPLEDELPIYLLVPNLGLLQCGNRGINTMTGPGLGKNQNNIPYGHSPYQMHYLQKAQLGELAVPRKEIEDLPIFKDITGKRIMLPKEEQINPDKIVRLLNIKADVKIMDNVNTNSLSDAYYNMKASYNSNTSLVNAALYESTVAVTTKWNLQFLNSDFWKHGQAGLIDIADDIYPTYWYGKQHPFEFEFIVVNDPSVHKIFTNLELIANKAKPESFHYEVIGEAYDFAKDKVNMYFRQEAIKALWLYNGLDITYDRNFLRVQPKQQPKSADLIRTYFAKQDTINEVEDYYVSATNNNKDYRHLSGGEIVYYPTRQEFRVWNHTKAVDIDDLKDTSPTSFGGRGLIASNMRYLEDKWYVTINPLLVCYKNEYRKGLQYSTWAKAFGSNQLLPPLPIYNSPIPNSIKTKGTLDIPGLTLDDETSYGKTNAMYHLYDTNTFDFLDSENWLNRKETYGQHNIWNFGEAQNRKETDVRDKFVKVRIRYSGEELAVIDWINTIYQISYA